MSNLTKTLNALKKLKWPENKSVGYEVPIRKDKYINPLLTPPPKSPMSAEDFRNPHRLGHWVSFGFDYTSKVADRYFFHEAMAILFIAGIGTIWLWFYGFVGRYSHQQQQQQRQQQQQSQEQQSEINGDDNNQIVRRNSGQLSIVNDLEMRLYNVLPLRATSSLWGRINSYDLPIWMRSSLYDFFCRTYNCDMSEALESDYRNYKNLSEFFSRRLKPDSRPISQEPGVVSPADGLVVHFGPITDGRIEGVKGLNYSVQAFLGLPSNDYRKELIIDKENNELYNCIIYLAPGDYHRFHSPANWLVKYRKHFPGRLLSVRPSLMKRMPEVLHINERVCYFGQWVHGFFSMTAVGATNVGSIKVNFDEDLRTNRRHLWRGDRYACFEHEFEEDIGLEAGQDFGEFNFGSTIVLIFEAPKNSTFDMKANQKIKYGQLMAKIEPPRPTPPSESQSESQSQSQSETTSTTTTTIATTTTTITSNKTQVTS